MTFYPSYDVHFSEIVTFNLKIRSIWIYRYITTDTKNNSLNNQNNYIITVVAKKNTSHHQTIIIFNETVRSRRLTSPLQVLHLMFIEKNSPWSESHFLQIRNQSNVWFRFMSENCKGIAKIFINLVYSYFNGLDGKGSN